MCLTGMPALHAGFGRGEEASPAAGLGALKRCGGRSCHSRGRRHHRRHHRGAVSADGLARAKPGPCCAAAPSAPRTAPDTAPSARHPGPGRQLSLPRRAPVPLSACPAGPLSPCPAAPCPSTPLSCCSDTPPSRCPSVPLSRLRQPPALSPASAAGRSLKLLPSAWRCRRGFPAGTHATHTPQGTETGRGKHRPRLATASPTLPGGGQECRGWCCGGAPRRTQRRAGDGHGESDAPRRAAVLAACPHMHADIAARSRIPGQPRSLSGECLLSAQSAPQAAPRLTSAVCLEVYPRDVPGRAR